MKKKVLFAMVATMLIISAASCGNQPASTTKAASTTAATEAPAAKADVKAADVTKAVLEAVPMGSTTSPFEKSKDSTADEFDFDEDMIENLADSSFVIGSMGSPESVAAFKFDSADTAGSALSKVQERLETQKKYYVDYSPEEAYMFDDAVVSQKGEWVIYLVTSDNTKAKEIALGLIG